MRSNAPRLISILCLLLLLGGCEEGANLNPRERAELQQIFNEARQLDDRGRYHEALVRYETILAQHPEYMSTRLNAAMAAYDSGQYEKSATHFEILHKYGPNDWFVIRKLIQCNERLNRPDDVTRFRKKLDNLREQKDGSPLLKRYEGLTRDYIPVGSMHLIGYEFFEPKKHGRLWFFRLEDRRKVPVSAFLLESTPFFDKGEFGKRLFTLTEATNGWMRVWYVGSEGRDYAWTRDFVLECLHGKRQPLVTKPLPPDYEALAAPDTMLQPHVKVNPDKTAPPRANEPPVEGGAGVPSRREPGEPREPAPAPQGRAREQANPKPPPEGGAGVPARRERASPAGGDARPTRSADENAPQEKRRGKLFDPGKTPDNLQE